jgi:hypothetical protein
MSYEGEEAVAGPFEDIPVLIVVTIAVGIFLISLVSAYVTYLDQYEHQRMHDDAQRLSRSIRGYDGLTYGSQEGVFSAEKVTSLSPESLSLDYNEDSLGFHYQISIIDKSDYSENLLGMRTFESSEPPLSGNRYSVTDSVLIKMDNEYHAGQLVVTVWS